MKKLPLLPHYCQTMGFILFVPFLVLGVLYIGWDYQIPALNYHFTNGNFFDFAFNNLTDELASVGIIISLMLIAFSKEKTEDEAIQFFRLASLQWAVIVNYVILIAVILLVYGTDFLSVMIYNMFTILFIFNLRFRFVLFQHNRSAA